MTRTIPFTKMVGAGNDFLVVDTVRAPALRPLKGRWPAIARAVCRRQGGVGADGLLVLERSRRADVTMRVFNPDGSEAEMCGNGARCVARYVQARRGGRPRGVTLETAGGLVDARVHGPRVRIRMPDPSKVRQGLAVRVDGKLLRATYLETGVPHTVVPVSGLDRLDVVRLGRAVRAHRRFRPHGTNVDFVRAPRTGGSRLTVRTYERGVEDETPACGTGVAASAVAHALASARRTQGRGGPRPAGRPGSRGGRPLEYAISVRTRGGETMRVSCTLTRDGPRPRVTNLTLEGSARTVCEGTVAWPPEGPTG